MEYVVHRVTMRQRARTMLIVRTFLHQILRQSDANVALNTAIRSIDIIPEAVEITGTT